MWTPPQQRGRLPPGLNRLGPLPQSKRLQDPQAPRPTSSLPHWRSPHPALGLSWIPAPGCRAHTPSSTFPHSVPLARAPDPRCRQSSLFRWIVSTPIQCPPEGRPTPLPRMPQPPSPGRSRPCCGEKPPASGRGQLDRGLAGGRLGPTDPDAQGSHGPFPAACAQKSPWGSQTPTEAPTSGHRISSKNKLLQATKFGSGTTRYIPLICVYLSFVSSGSITITHARFTHIHTQPCSHSHTYTHHTLTHTHIHSHSHSLS